MPSVAYHWIHHWPMKTFKVWRNFYLKDRLKKPRSGSLGNHSQKSVDWSSLFSSSSEKPHYSTNMTFTTLQIAVPAVLERANNQVNSLYTITHWNKWVHWLDQNYVIRGWFFSSLIVKTCAFVLCWFILSTLAASASIMTENALR